MHRISPFIRRRYHDLPEKQSPESLWRCARARAFSVSSMTRPPTAWTVYWKLSFPKFGDANKSASSCWFCGATGFEGLQVHRDRLSVENGGVRMPETTISPER
jgi:hypothetical protein